MKGVETAGTAPVLGQRKAEEGRRAGVRYVSIRGEAQGSGEIIPWRCHSHDRAKCGIGVW